MLSILCIILMSGILAGTYPALYLTTSSAADNFKSSLHPHTGKLTQRRISVVFQYAISVAMIICSLLLFKQLRYLREKDPGFTRENILIITLSTKEVSHKHELLKSDLLQIPGVQNIAVSSHYPGNGIARNGYKPEGAQDWVLTDVMDADEDLVPVLGLKILKGRDFSKNRPTDVSKYLVNEAFVRSMNWDNPLGKFIERNGMHEVIGVFRDFNFAPLQQPITPMIISMIPEEGFNYLLIRVQKGQMNRVVRQIKARWNVLVPDVPIDYFYLDDVCRKVYSSESNLSQLVLLFTFLVIFIAFLGLFGLSSYETERQTKNIGIRKVNGADISEIIFLLSKRFIQWVFLSFAIAWPLAFFIMHKWLQHFAYKTALSWWIFALAGIIAVVIALISIGWQTWLAARRDPVTALRYE